MGSKRRGVTFQQVREMMLALPGVEEGGHHGTPAFRVRGKFMSRLREDDVLVLKPIEHIVQEFLMATDPDAFFLTDHYRGYPTILIRLSAVDPKQLRGLIEQSWRALAGRSCSRRTRLSRRAHDDERVRAAAAAGR